MKTTFSSSANIQLISFTKLDSISKKGFSLRIIAAFALLVLAFSAFTFRPAIEEKVIVHLQQPLEEAQLSAYFVNPTLRTALAADLAQVYSTNNYNPLWLENGKPSAKLESLVLALKAAEQEGLNANTYHVTQIERLKEQSNSFADAAQVAELDQLATAAYLLYASHLFNGSVAPGQLGSNWHLQPKSIALAQYLNQALESGNIKQSLQDLANVNPAYTQLKTKLASLKAVAENGGWPVIATDRVLVKNDAGAAVLTIKKRLMLAGDLDSTLSKTDLFDQALVQAVQRFQKRHGLPLTGKTDEKTVTALNVPVEKRIEQVVLNLERMRWLPRRNGETVIKVNIPDYKLRVYEGNKSVMEANVVVGKTNFATPVFEDSLESIVFSPEWNVPNQIATEEILPALQNNPGYLRKHNFEVYDSYSANAKPINPYSVNWNSVSPEKFKYRFVQKANAKNALGAVKFLFPNSYNIYIHDTPAKQLFKENKRAYSHGCIRLENPGKLAARLLKKEADWSEAKIQEKMGLTESTKVVLKKAIKVEIMYLTAFVQDGQLQFREDIYGYDQPQLLTLRN